MLDFGISTLSASDSVYSASDSLLTGGGADRRGLPFRSRSRGRLVSFDFYWYMVGVCGVPIPRSPVSICENASAVFSTLAHRLLITFPPLVVVFYAAIQQVLLL